MIQHNHVLQGEGAGCSACASIRPESQVHPSLIPPLPVAYAPTTFAPEDELDEDPTTPAHVAALAEGTHRIVDERPVCLGAQEAKCHWWPDPSECDHEEFPCGHEYVFHDDCWIIQWLEAVDLSDTAEDSAFDERVGDDLDDVLRWPNGVIDYEWHGDYLTWRYVSVDVEPTPVAPAVPAPLPDGRRESDIPLW